MEKSSIVIIIFLIVITSVIIELFNYKIKLEKTDEDWAWENISQLHLTDRTLVEDSSNNKLELNFLTSNNYFHFNYYIIKFINKTLDYTDNFFDIKRFGYKNIINKNKIENKKNIKNKLDSKDYKSELINGNFKFAKNKYIFKEKKNNFFYHYNYIYIINILLFLSIISIIYKFSYYYIYPTLIYFLTPQINSFILFINSDFLIILLTPLIYIFFKEKKYSYVFIILFFLQIFNRSNILLLLLFSHYIYFYYNYYNIKLKYRVILYAFILLIISFTLNQLGYLDNSSLFKSGLFYLYENNLYLFFYDITKSIGIFFISHLYLNGQNSFITNVYDYIIFISFIIFYLIYSILFLKNKFLNTAIVTFIITIIFINGFDQFKHHPFIYVILIFQFFEYEKNNIKIIKYINFLYIIFLIYVNVKTSYLEIFIF
jgi:hypothetical protein